MAPGLVYPNRHLRKLVCLKPRGSAPGLVSPSRHLRKLVSREPRGSAPGLTHPDLHAVAIARDGEDAMQAGGRDVKPAWPFRRRNVRHRAPAWVGYPRADGPGLIVTNPSPSGGAQQPGRVRVPRDPGPMAPGL